MPRNTYTKNEVAPSKRRGRSVTVKPLEKRWLSTKDACEYLGISRDTLRELRDSGNLTFSRVGQKLTWYSLESIERLLNKGIVLKVNNL